MQVGLIWWLNTLKVFASLMTGNVLFIGLAFAQGDVGLLIRAAIALVGVTVGALVIHRAPLRRTARGRRNRIVITLLIEWIFLLAFAFVWFITSNLIHTQQSAGQIILLGLAAFGMGIQGVVVIAFEFPGVVANAMPSVVLVLGQRVGRGIAGKGMADSGPQASEWRWTFLLPVLYALGAVAVGLTSASPLMPIFPLIVSTIAIIYVLSRVA